MQISILTLISDEDLDSESSTENNPAMQKGKRRIESSDEDEVDLGARFARLVKESPNLGDFADKLMELNPALLNTFSKEELKDWLDEIYPEKTPVWRVTTLDVLSNILAKLFKQ